MNETLLVVCALFVVPIALRAQGKDSADADGWPRNYAESCRAAADVTRNGGPTPLLSRARLELRRCPKEVAVEVVRRMAASKNATDSTQLNDVLYLSMAVRSRSVLDASLRLAEDPASSVFARANAIVIATMQLTPRWWLTPQAIWGDSTAACGLANVSDAKTTVVEALSEDSGQRLRTLIETIRTSTSPASPLYRTANCVGRIVQ